MNLENLIKHLRESILDDTGGTGVVWQDIDEDSDASDQLRWSNEELTRAINEAFLQAHRRSLLIKESSPTFDITVTTGNPTYALDPRIIRIKGAKLVSTGNQLTKAEVEEVWDQKDWDTQENTPTHYIVDYNSSSFTLYPIPIVDDTVKLLYYRSELTPLSWSNPTGTPEIPERYQIPALHYAAFMCFNKDEANTLDPRKAQYHLALFQAEFSETSAYIEKRRERTSYRTIQYRDVI